MKVTFGIKAIVMIAMTAFGSLLLIGSPILILKATKLLAGDAELAEMSEVGQAYGGISAILSALAVVAVAAALVVQIRQAKTGQAQGMRLIQLELMRMLMEDLSLRPLSPSHEPVDPLIERRRSIYTNLILKYLELGYEIGYFSTESVRDELSEQFSAHHAREFWEKNRGFRERVAANAAQRRFVLIADEAFETSAVTDGQGETNVESGKEVRATPLRGPRLLVGLSLGVTICAAGWAVHEMARASGAEVSTKRTDSRFPTARL